MLSRHHTLPALSATYGQPLPLPQSSTPVCVSDKFPSTCELQVGLMVKLIFQRYRWRCMKGRETPHFFAESSLYNQLLGVEGLSDLMSVITCQSGLGERLFSLLDMLNEHPNCS